jgi:hypothetical protein
MSPSPITVLESSVKAYKRVSGLAVASKRSMKSARCVRTIRSPSVRRAVHARRSHAPAVPWRPRCRRRSEIASRTAAARVRPRGCGASAPTDRARYFANTTPPDSTASVHTPATPADREQRRLEPPGQLATTRGRQTRFRSASRRMCLSSVRLATSRFKRAFSSSSYRIRRTSCTPRWPQRFFQTRNACADRDAADARGRLATAPRSR